jgi:glycosyltransferase involved in cell wall biosynthesis
MKLLVIGHAFLLAYIQKKYVAMKQLNPDLCLRLVVPTCMRDRFHYRAFEVHPDLVSNEIVPLRARLAQSHMTYLHNPGGIAQVLREFRPDVVHIEEEPQALITLETIALQRAIAPCAAVTLFSWDNLLRRRRFPLHTLKRRLRRYSLCRVAAVICGNRRAAELLHGEGYFSGPVEVLPQYGLDVDEHQPGTDPTLRAKLGLQGSMVVGYVGRLVPEKGLRILLAALDELRSYPWKLLLVGAGPLENEIREKWMARHPARIVLLPAVRYEQVPQYLRCADIFALPSYSTPRWMEQFGLAVAQAMLLGIPVIGSSSGAIPEVLGPGGIVFGEGNTEEFTRALKELLDSPDRRKELGMRGREFGLRNYTLEGVAGRYHNLFERVLGRATPKEKQGREAMSLESAAGRKA